MQAAAQQQEEEDRSAAEAVPEGAADAQDPTDQQLDTAAAQEEPRDVDRLPTPTQAADAEGQDAPAEQPAAEEKAPAVETEVAAD